LHGPCRPDLARFRAGASRAGCAGCADRAGKPAAGRIVSYFGGGARLYNPRPRRTEMMKTRLARTLCVVFTLGGLAALTLRADDQPAAGDAAQPAAAKGAAAEGRYFEMRTYHAAPGKLEALHDRFRDHTLRLFDKHGIESVAYWTAAPADGKPADTLVFILAYKDKDAREAAWKAFAEDPDWVKAKAASEEDGPLVQKVDQVFMSPTDYSPLK
jgi:hypothetical protein